MPRLPRPPADCADLDFAWVERTLTKHFGDIPAAAKELDLSIPDLRRLTWAKPDLLEEAELECMGIIARAVGELIRALTSDDPRRREWASEKIMSSYMARNHPLAPARRGVEARAAAASSSIVFKWQDGVDAVTPPAADSAAPPISPPLELPIWQGRDPPPPLVAGKYRPWEEPRRSEPRR